MAEPPTGSDDGPLQPSPAPRAPAWRFGDTARRFAFEIAAITVGILIALSFDAIGERSRERRLVQDARAAIARELGENRAALDKHIPMLDSRFDDLRAALELADDLLKGPSDRRSLQLGFDLPTLNESAWQTAERTGALGYMDYAEVKAYSEIYQQQQLLVSEQRQAIGRISSLLGVLAPYGGDPTKASRQDLEVFRSRVGDALGASYIYQQLAQQLSKAYAEAVKRRPSAPAR